jgi:RNA processing factor Prp31
MEIDIKSIGTLIDELSIINIRIWMMIDIVTGNDIKTHTEEDIANTARKLQELNAKRTKLIRAIDERLGEKDISASEKTYG